MPTPLRPLYRPPVERGPEQFVILTPAVPSTVRWLWDDKRDPVLTGPNRPVVALGPEQFAKLVQATPPSTAPLYAPPYGPGFFDVPDYGLSTTGLLAFIPGNFIHLYSDYGTYSTMALNWQYLPGGAFLTTTYGVVPYGIGRA